MSDIHLSKQIAAVRTELSRHGYGFQYAVLKRCSQTDVGQLKWRPDGTEFPVEVNGAHLHVDLLLRGPKAMLVCECKRVNPAYGAWCFGRSAHVTRDQSAATDVSYEIVGFDDSQGRAFVERHSEMSTEHQYHVGLELKTDEKGDPHGTPKGALNDALTQALRGVNGIANAISQDRRLMNGAQRLALIPVIFTTARLLVCDADLAMADLDTGKIPDDVPVSERTWLWLRCATTAQIRHGLQKRFKLDQVYGFEGVSNISYARSVGIVFAGGLQDFLRVASQHVGQLF